jgi:hypothetical protein
MASFEFASRGDKGEERYGCPAACCDDLHTAGIVYLKYLYIYKYFYVDLVEVFLC